MSPSSSGANKTSAASLENGSTERPWKDVAQSTCVESSSWSLIGWSAGAGAGDEEVVVDFVVVGGGGFATAGSALNDRDAV